MPRFACVECNKKFDSEGAMRMHEADKHGRKRLVPLATPKARLGFVGTFCAAFLGTICAIGVVAGAVAVAYAKLPGAATMGLTAFQKASLR
jgi:hypothetical protein